MSFITGVDRPIFPSQIANDRFGNENTPFKGVKEVWVKPEYDYLT